MARLAFERDFTLKQLKAKYDYHEFLPRHVDKRAKTLFVSMKLKLSKSIDSTLEETYNNFYCINNSPLRQSIISYLKELLQSVPTYVSLCANVLFVPMYLRAGAVVHMCFSVPWQVVMSVN